MFAFAEDGSRHLCHVLLDCGSQANFISKGLVDRLGINDRPFNIFISGVNNTASSASQVAQVRLQSRANSFAVTIDCIVTDRITDRIPAFTLKRSAYAFPRNLELADPQFHVSAEVDILIGAELFWQLLCVG